MLMHPTRNCILFVPPIIISLIFRDMLCLIFLWSSSKSSISCWCACLVSSILRSSTASVSRFLISTLSFSDIFNIDESLDILSTFINKDIDWYPQSSVSVINMVSFVINLHLLIESYISGRAIFSPDNFGMASKWPAVKFLLSYIVFLMKINFVVGFLKWLLRFISWYICMPIRLH